MGAPRLVQVTCPACGAGMRIDPKSDVVTCAYCNKSSFVHRPKEAVVPPPVHQQDYGHIYVPADAARAMRGVVLAAVLVPTIGVLAVVVIGAVVRSASNAVVGSPPFGPSPQTGPLSAPAGPSCKKAIACCKAIQPGNTGCDGMGMLGEESCAQQVEQLRMAARAMGRTCP